MQPISEEQSDATSAGDVSSASSASAAHVRNNNNNNRAAPESARNNPEAPVPSSRQKDKDKKDKRSEFALRDEEESIRLEQYSSTLELADGQAASNTSDDSAEMDNWCDETQQCGHSLGTAGTQPHDNRTGDNVSQQQPPHDSIMHLDWGQESLPAELDAFNDRVTMSRLTKWQRRSSNHYGNPDDIFKTESSNADDDDQAYVCFGCIKREWSSSNPALAMVIICIQIIIVVIFVMLFYPFNTEQALTNSTSTAVPINGEAITFTPAPATINGPDVVPTQAPFDSIGTPTLSSTTPEPPVSPTTATMEPTHSASPTIPPLGTTMFLQWLPQETRDAISSDFESPQARAFDWMLQDPNWNGYTRTRIVQRFALATLYYATARDDEWTQSDGWLDYDTHECDWLRVSTNSPSLYAATNTACDTTASRDYQTIQLANNNLEGTIPLELQLLTKLQIIDLSQNLGLSGSLPEAILEECTDLQHLVVFGAQLTGSIPSAISNLGQLQSFHAWDNLLMGPAFPDALMLTTQATTSNLKNWHVGNNQLTGSFPSTNNVTALRQQQQQQPPLSSLESVWVYGNRMTGSLPAELGEWSRLTSLLAWGNQLSGNLPTQLGSLLLLEQLDLEENALQGSLPSELGLLSTRLQGLWLSSNNLSSTIPSELSQLLGLTILSLHSNDLTGTIMTEMGLLLSLYKLDLQANNLSGTLPTQLGDMRSLRDLNAYSNQLVGPLPTDLGRLLNLERLDLEQNAFNNAIPSELGLLTSKLTVLDLSASQLTSTIPSELGNLIVVSDSGNGAVGGHLEQLRLFQNQLSGSLPDEMFPNDAGSSSPLVQLVLEQNSLTGTVSTFIGRYNSLQELRLNDCALTGSVPSEIGQLGDRLVKLELAENRLTSFIPTEIGKLLLLTSLTLNDNQLWWTIPTEIGLLSRTLQTLHLSDNNLAGSMPPDVGNLEELEEFHLHNNPFLFGSIPTEELAGMSKLRELTLNGTSLTGTIPNGLCAIDELLFDCSGSLCGCDCPCS